MCIYRPVTYHLKLRRKFNYLKYKQIAFFFFIIIESNESRQSIYIICTMSHYDNR